jgi:hypothetical protein
VIIGKADRDFSAKLSNVEDHGNIINHNDIKLEFIENIDSLDNDLMLKEFWCTRF